MKELVRKIFCSNYFKRALVGLAYTKPGLTKSEYVTLNRIFSDTDGYANQKVKAKVISMKKAS